MASRDYPEDFVQKALELAAAIGQRPAAKQLEIPYETLHRWTKQPDYTARWAELRAVNAPAWRKRAAATLEELVDSYTNLEVDALVKASQDYDKLEPRDIGNFLRSLAVAKGVTADHVGKLRNQPTHIVQHQTDPAQLEQAMQKILESVDSTAEEIHELSEGDTE